MAVWKVPSPRPNSTETVPSNCWLATAKSALPSRLKSPVATEIGFVPALNAPAVTKLDAGQVADKAGLLRKKFHTSHTEHSKRARKRYTVGNLLDILSLNKSPM